MLLCGCLRGESLAYIEWNMESWGKIAVYKVSRFSSAKHVFTFGRAISFVCEAGIPKCIAHF